MACFAFLSLERYPDRYALKKGLARFQIHKSRINLTAAELLKS